ncbi:MAG: type II methionyl aminopeptidase [Candidatus Aenigmarchaeota archaeon]|nr:type II methionyl aminopeptidase [Candidatus Aenigmarchaeota archaeon]
MDDEIKEKYIRAGKIASEVMEEGRNIIKPGIKLVEIAGKLEGMIKEKGGHPAFPLNLSLNELAAHYTPYKGDETTLKRNDVLKVDLGVHVDGYVADTAYTISFSEAHEKLSEASKTALENAVAVAKPGALISDISSKIEETIRGYGFNPVSNLTGHGLENYHLHAEPQIPNVRFNGLKRLSEGQVIAIEPFATAGAGRIKETEPILIFMFLKSRPVRNQDARKIIDFVQRFNGLPFAERWLMDKEAASFGLPDSLFKIRIALKELREKGVIYDYAPLKEVANGLVSQYEHTIIVEEEPIVTTK